MPGPGLYANIHAKRKRGGKMRKKGDKGAPTAANFKRAAQTARKGMKKGGFPDLSGHGKTTMKDILIGRGVIKKGDKKMQKKTAMKRGGMAGMMGARKPSGSIGTIFGMGARKRSGARRLGSGASGLRRLKRSPFFSGLDWAVLDMKLAPSPLRRALTLPLCPSVTAHSFSYIT